MVSGFMSPVICIVPSDSQQVYSRPLTRCIDMLPQKGASQSAWVTVWRKLHGHNRALELGLSKTIGQKLCVFPCVTIQ